MNHAEKCPVCGGSGKVVDTVLHSASLPFIECDECRGTGKGK